MVWFWYGFGVVFGLEDVGILFLGWWNRVLDLKCKHGEIDLDLDLDFVFTFRF